MGQLQCRGQRSLAFHGVASLTVGSVNGVVSDQGCSDVTWCSARRGHCKNTSDSSFSMGLNLNELLFFCVS